MRLVRLMTKIGKNDVAIKSGSYRICFGSMHLMGNIARTLSTGY